MKNKEVIIACDFPGMAHTLVFLDKLNGLKPFVKIGMELFYSEGPQIVKELKKQGYKIFLDLKLHDIPNTVKNSMAVLSGLGADIVNLHASGTIAMMEAALEGITRPDGSRPLLIAVTQLTSTSRQRMNDELLIGTDMEHAVCHYAQNAKTAGLDGVVCSPLEANMVHDVCGKDFITVTPGIRFDSANAGDQVRITTPAQASELGCDYIVVGRPITKAADPYEAYLSCIKDFTGKETDK